MRERMSDCSHSRNIAARSVHWSAPTPRTLESRLRREPDRRRRLSCERTYFPTSATPASWRDWLTMTPNEQSRGPACQEVASMSVAAASPTVVHHQRPHGVFRLDDHVRGHLRLRPVEQLGGRQGQASPQIHLDDLRSSWQPAEVKAGLETTEPEGWWKQLKRSEDVPQERLTVAVSFDRAGPHGWPTKSVGMMSRDDDLLSNRLDRRCEDCFWHLWLVSHAPYRTPGTIGNRATDTARSSSA